MTSILFWTLPLMHCYYAVPLFATSGGDWAIEWTTNNWCSVLCRYVFSYLLSLNCIKLKPWAEFTIFFNTKYVMPSWEMVFLDNFFFKIFCQTKQMFVLKFIFCLFEGRALCLYVCWADVKCGLICCNFADVKGSVFPKSCHLFTVVI